MRIIQLLVTLQKGDAIGNYTLHLHKIFEENGLNAEIYAYNIGSNINESNVKSIKQLSHVKKDDLIIYHMCESGEINKLIRKLPAHKIAIYHNTTPPEFFANFGTYLKNKQEISQKEISELRDIFERCIADSEFNKSDLIAMGYEKEKVDVLPVLIDFEDYKKTPDSNVIKKYRDEYVNILFVGRVAPNKKQEDVIRAFAYYHRFINKKSRLFLIGSPFIKDYDDALQKYIAYLNLEHCVIMLGHSTFQEVLAYYFCADVFLCMSEHEGFCVPLVEAMLFDVPIVAYKSSAIPLTMKDSGVLIDSKEPKVVAAAVERILSDDKYRKSLIEGQRERLKDFQSKYLEEQYLEYVNRWSEKG